MKQERVYHIELCFNRTIRKNVCTNLTELIEFMRHVDVMMEENDTATIYYYEQVERLDGYTSLQKIIVFDGTNVDVENMMRAY